ncbi:hypothetical protein RvY_03694 [Ramazzottius varieornatus]|uniref:Uncharacterized protein n=1 Tax=Ramazzottius varieornatus TaxID=947166 RepID=A0A1D1UP05_RAMVA|nr:hypothetical protein RvY_03694 [Ramazzottius varieornatus]
MARFSFKQLQIAMIEQLWPGALQDDGAESPQTD